MENRLLLELKDVSYFYEKDSLILDKINFKLRQSDFIGLRGTNGAGKTTLIKIITGILKPKNGEVITHIDKKGAFGYVRQNITFADKFPANVFEIVNAGLYPKYKYEHLSDKDGSDFVKKALKLMEMDGFEKKLIGELSGGQKQRVLIAKAIVCEPEVMVLDEPDSGIDEKSAINLYELLSKINKERKISILLISHDIHALYKYTKKVYLLNDGKLYDESEEAQS